jgi:hypothetical protein
MQLIENGRKTGKFTTKEEALEDMKKELAKDPNLVGMGIHQTKDGFWQPAFNVWD